MNRAARIDAPALYLEFLRWFEEGCPDAEIPSRSLFTRKMGRHFRHKLKNGRRISIGLTLQGREDESLDLEEIVERFIDEACEPEKGARVQAMDLYRAFEEWHRREIGPRIPTQKAFGTAMTLKAGEKGVKKDVITGKVFYRGVRVKEG